jgi:hypothetical protein
MERKRRSSIGSLIDEEKKMEANERGRKEIKRNRQSKPIDSINNKKFIFQK